MTEVSEIGELIELKRSSKGTSRGTLLVGMVNDRDTGANNPMSFVEAKYGVGERGHWAKLVIRKAYIFNLSDCIGGEKMNMSESERYYERWRFLKKHGIPTIDSMRIVDHDRVAMGDATVNGGEFFGKAKKKLIEREVYQGKRRALTNKEKRYLEIFESGELESEVKRISKLMSEAGLCFPKDDYFDLIIHDDGSFDVLVMDLSLLSFGDEESTPDDLMSIQEDLSTGLKTLVL